MSIAETERFAADLTSNAASRAGPERAREQMACATPSGATGRTINDAELDGVAGGQAIVIGDVTKDLFGPP
jgi:hypothetical protein